MRILILDTIHGGGVIGEALVKRGHSINLIDVYRGDTQSPHCISPQQAIERDYDLLIHPVHLNPAYPLLRTLTCPSITHHQAVRWIIGEELKHVNPKPVIVEITGARGKTTTATALAFLLKGPGILHTSRGVFRCPGEEPVTRLSITPASLIQALQYGNGIEWMIGEISLGFIGNCDLAILTSNEDYQIAGGNQSAYDWKKRSGFLCKQILVPKGVSIGHDSEISTGDLITITGATCHYHYNDLSGEFENPLFILDGYNTPLQLAAAAALVLGIRPDRLSEFISLPGRMQIIYEKESVIIDNASTGACLKTTCDAIRLLQQIAPSAPFSLIIGQEDRAVCENFLADDILTAIKTGPRPAEVFLVAGDDRLDANMIVRYCTVEQIPVCIVKERTSGIDCAKSRKFPAIVVSVKTWR
jgi:hypothetical protein